MRGSASCAQTWLLTMMNGCSVHELGQFDLKQTNLEFECHTLHNFTNSIDTCTCFSHTCSLSVHVTRCNSTCVMIKKCIVFIELLFKQRQQRGNTVCFTTICLKRAINVLNVIFFCPVPKRSSMFTTSENA